MDREREGRWGGERDKISCHFIGGMGFLWKIPPLSQVRCAEACSYCRHVSIQCSLGHLCLLHLVLSVPSHNIDCYSHPGENGIGG